MMSIFKRKLILFSGISQLVMVSTVYSFTPSDSIKAELEEKTANFFEQQKSDPNSLKTFIYKMPKGGNIHYHLAGSTMAENLIKYAQSGSYCINDDFTIFKKNICNENEFDTKALFDNSEKTEKVINAWSVREFESNENISPSFKFFSTFAKYKELVSENVANILQEIRERAVLENLSYIEVMYNPEVPKELISKFTWDDDLSRFRNKVIAAGLKEKSKEISDKYTQFYNQANEKMHCNTNKPDKGCEVNFKFICEVSRNFPPHNVFIRLLTAFEIASHNPLVVGITLVAPEHYNYSKRDYTLHMEMIRFLRKHYPNVKVNLHAGELNQKQVTLNDITYHIEEAVNIANSNRIGHGVSIAYERNVDKLLNSMRDKGVAVEINISSNRFILGVYGKNHPLPFYMKNNIPLVISSDDEGILRTTISHEFYLATMYYDLKYKQIKKMIRNSLYYSFSPGQSLWTDANYTQVVDACRGENPSTAMSSESCKKYLQNNEKAKMQWTLEQQFHEFENYIVHQVDKKE